MLGLGFAEILLIAVLALIFIGPKQLPEVARVIARLLNEWKRATSDFTSSFHDMRTDLHTQIEARPPAASKSKAQDPVPPPAAEVKPPSPIVGSEEWHKSLPPEMQDHDEFGKPIYAIKKDEKKEDQ